MSVLLYLTDIHLYWLLVQGHASACEVMAHHLGLEKRGLETMNSYELKKLHEKTREEVSQVQREMLLKVQVIFQHTRPINHVPGFFLCDEDRHQQTIGRCK